MRTSTSKSIAKLPEILDYEPSKVNDVEKYSFKTVTEDLSDDS